ncbi:MULTISPECIES: MBOAT family protein [Exiguobacterium]|uniref:MBOAT family O-acyltransferase n=1 Tax=Exiguobacterium TaxID=33986 RepID=UPI00047CF031|nr:MULTISPECIES: MBOAT family protein [Exiguobacterium]MCK2158025.1 MBOAT family protein [Exiguobacterium sp. 17-1]RDB34804.1 MBOAT family protein [Exiguobacterium sp. RIT594]
MLFSSTIFLFLFLPTVLIVYYLLPRSFRNGWLLVASLFFYAFGEPRFALLMLLSVGINYFFALFVDVYRHRIGVKWIMFSMIAVNLGLLGWFKYSGFFVQSVNKTFHADFFVPEIVLPLGISFYTFHAMSYVIDIYKEKEAVQKNPLDLALYIAFFPQLVAGPIVRYNTIASQIESRQETVSDFSKGVRRFIIGLSKKLILANGCGQVADAIFDMKDLSMGLAWIGIIAYALQIYFDFSGYSDMAIGLALMFGFHFLENFNYPYISKSVSEFWRRWHISLGSWFRDYVYIPLGGNRVSPWRQYRNLGIVWMLTGLWHGASWTFVAWGVYYGIWIMLEKAFLGKLLARVPVLATVWTLVLVLVGWVFFRSETFPEAITYIQAMFMPDVLWDDRASYQLVQNGVILALACLAATPIPKWIGERFVQSSGKIGQTLQYGYAMVLLFLATSALVASTFNPFIYFRF